jgi:hypothetical protein
MKVKRIKDASLHRIAEVLSNLRIFDYFIKVYSKYYKNPRDCKE